MEQVLGTKREADTDKRIFLLEQAIAKLTIENQRLEERLSARVENAKSDMAGKLDSYLKRLISFKAEIMKDTCEEKSDEMRTTSQKAMECTEAWKRCKEIEKRITELYQDDGR